MRNHWIAKYLPTRQSIRAQKALWPVRHLLLEPELWHLHRRSVGGAFFIGLFCAFMPVPSQMVLAALLALVARCNLPIAVGLVWVTNPLTIGTDVLLRLQTRCLAHQRRSGYRTLGALLAVVRFEVRRHLVAPDGGLLRLRMG